MKPFAPVTTIDSPLPSYTVITVCLNSASTIDRTIDSVLSQSVKPLEYLFVDGGSTDGTLGKIERSMVRMADLGVATELVHQKSQGGITEAWNIGIERSRADIIFILNSDDWYRPGAAAIVLQAFADPTVGVVLASGFYTTDDGTIGTLTHTRPFFLLPVAMTIVHPGCFVRKSVYEQLGFYDTRYRIAADYDFTYRFRKAGVNVLDLRQVLVDIQLGGLAGRSRVLARREVRDIALRYTRFSVLPWLAYTIRRATGR